MRVINISGADYYSVFPKFDHTADRIIAIQNKINKLNFANRLPLITTNEVESIVKEFKAKKQLPTMYDATKQFSYYLSMAIISHDSKTLTQLLNLKKEETKNAITKRTNKIADFCPRL